MNNSDPFDEGYRAALDDFIDNPYPIGSDDWEEWEAGFESAAADDEDDDY